MNASSSALSLRFPHRHLLGIEGLSADAITMLLDLADTYVEQNRKPNKALSLLQGRTVINLFFESSTRTRTSFELAGKRLGADVINMSVSTSSIKKGETMIDTAMNARTEVDSEPENENLRRCLFLNCIYGTQFVYQCRKELSNVAADGALTRNFGFITRFPSAGTR